MKVFGLVNVRTNNYAEDMGAKIGQAWQAAMEQLGENCGAKFGIYHEYDGNYRNDYTLTIATENVKTEDEVELSDEDYRIFEVEGGEPTSVYETWKKVWQLEDSGELDRAYTKDYEKYNPDGSVSIYIAVKN